jgi:hypothetical protein
MNNKRKMKKKKKKSWFLSWSQWQETATWEENRCSESRSKPEAGNLNQVTSNQGEGSLWSAIGGTQCETHNFNDL